MADITKKQELIDSLHKSYLILRVHGMISDAESAKIKSRILREISRIEKKMEKLKDG